MKTIEKCFALFLAAALGGAAQSCNGMMEDPISDMEDYGQEIQHGMIVLGNKLEDPYSVGNMTKALQSLYPTKAASIGTLTPTHTYVRFLLSGQDEYTLLESLGVDMLDHPMDYEILQEGDYYHDPQIAQDAITWQYASVPADFVCPEGIRCEKLDECFIADESTKADGIDWEAVERESFRLTGNAWQEMSSETKAGSSSKPEGRITVLDEKFDTEPIGLKCAKVTCNVFVKTAAAFTDEEGYYKMSKSFSAKPRYRISFANRKGFKIGFNAILVPASVSTLGKHSPKGYSLNVTKHSDGMLFLRCAVNNSAYDYFESCKSAGATIRTPPSNLRIWIFKKLESCAAIMFQQGVVTQSDMVSDLIGEYSFLLKIFAPDIILGLRNASDYSDIYASTVHELAHASHFCLAGIDFWETYEKFILTSFLSSGGITYGSGTEKTAGWCEVGEMWAYYVQTVLYNERYPDNPSWFGTSWWFYPQILCYLDERGLGRFSIFPALTSDVTSREALRLRLLSLYPEFKSTIVQAFNRYN